MTFSSPTHAGSFPVPSRRVRLGFVSAISIVLAFLWVLLAPIFSYEPSYSDIYEPPGTELAEPRIQILEHSNKKSQIKQMAVQRRIST